MSLAFEHASSGEIEMRAREHPGILKGRRDLLMAKPNQLKIEDGFNVRDLTSPEALAELDELEAGVKEHGILVPLKIRMDGKTLLVVEGHRRLTVVNRLIEKFRASGGAEGRKIEGVPVIWEPDGTTPLDRAYGLRHSNNGEKLKPLEFANLIYRTMQQHGLSDEDAAAGFGISITVLRNHLKMRAMPEPVKEQVRAGVVSATHAAKLVREQPEFAKELIEADAEEKKRLGKKGRATPKGTRKQTAKRNPPTPSRAPAEADPQSAPEPAAGTETVSALPPEQQPAASVEPPAASVPFSVSPKHIGEVESSAPLQEVTSVKYTGTDGTEQRLVPAAHFENPAMFPSQDRSVKDLIEALAPFAQLLNETDVNQYGDDESILVSIKHLKRAWEVYTKATGDDVRDAA